MKLPFILTIFVLIWGCQPSIKQDKLKIISTKEVEKAFQQHLNHFYPAIIDSINGGYYTNFEYDWSLGKNQDKMMVTQARDLWMASIAAQAFPKNPVYKIAAKHGFEFITSKMWDEETGGFRLNFSPENPTEKSNYKLLYGNAFALFALAEYAKIDTSFEVKQWTEKVFNWMEEDAHDNLYGGYFNLILNDELKADTPENKAIIQKMGWGNPNWKDQNTSIHILEAFTTLHQVIPTPKVEKRLQEMLVLVRDTMVQENGSLKLYFTREWKPIDHSDSTKAYILENQGTDHVSFGHNIETAYLLIDASKTLYCEVDSTTLQIARKLTDHTVKYGFGKDYYGLFDRGYVFNNEMEIIDPHKSWWAQFEAWHTLALMSQYFPEDTIYPIAFQNMWQYINTELIDSVYGGQLNFGIDTYQKNKKQQKAHAWKGPYHDGRALFEVWQYLKNGELKLNN